MNIEKFIKEDLEIRVKTNDGENLELSLEDISRGLGFVDTSKGTNKIIWNRVEKYITETTATQVSPYKRNGFIPEWVFYMLCMKAKNEKARKFQLWISKEVLPSLRRNNAYVNKDNITKEQLAEIEKEITELKRQKGILHDIVYDMADATTMSFTEVSKKLFGKDAKFLKQKLIENGFLAQDGITALIKEGNFNTPSGEVKKMRIFTSTNVEKCRGEEDIRYNKITNFGYMYLKKYFKVLTETNSISESSSQTNI